MPALGRKDAVTAGVMRSARGSNDGTKRPAQYARVLRYAAENALYIPLYYDNTSTTTAFRAGITGPGSVPPIQQVNTWNIERWDLG